MSTSLQGVYKDIENIHQITWASRRKAKAAGKRDAPHSGSRLVSPPTCTSIKLDSKPTRQQTVSSSLVCVKRERSPTDFSSETFAHGRPDVRCGGQRADRQEAACHRGTCPSGSWRWRPLALVGSTLPPQPNPQVLPKIWKQGLPLLQDVSGQLKSIFRVTGEQGSKHSHSHTPTRRLATLLCLRIIPYSLSHPRSQLIDPGMGTRALGFCKPGQLVGMG